MYEQSVNQSKFVHHYCSALTHLEMSSQSVQALTKIIYFDV